MNFDKQTVAPCIIPSKPTPDERCADSAFSLANPAICSSSLILKPSVVNLCRLESVQFRVFEYRNGTETEVTEGLVFTSSDIEVFALGVSSGSGTALAEGDVVITVAREGKTASATVSVLGEANCCADKLLATALVVDNSRSSSLPFGGGYSTRLDFAKAAAKAFSAIILTVAGEPKDRIKPWTINSITEDLMGAYSQTPAEIAAAVDGIAQTAEKTDLLLLFAAIAAEVQGEAAAPSIPLPPTPATSGSAGYGSPECVVEGNAGKTYTDITNADLPEFWVKTTATGKCGWKKLIA